MNATTSFILGWNYGKRNNVELSASEIEVQFPDVQADAFAQGNIDGMKADRFRLDIALKNKKAA